MDIGIFRCILWYNILVFALNLIKMCSLQSYRQQLMVNFSTDLTKETYDKMIYLIHHAKYHRHYYNTGINMLMERKYIWICNRWYYMHEQMHLSTLEARSNILITKVHTVLVVSKHHNCTEPCYPTQKHGYTCQLNCMYTLCLKVLYFCPMINSFQPDIKYWYVVLVILMILIYNSNRIL